MTTKSALHSSKYHTHYQQPWIVHSKRNAKTHATGERIGTYCLILTSETHLQTSTQPSHDTQFYIHHSPMITHLHHLSPSHTHLHSKPPFLPFQPTHQQPVPFSTPFLAPTHTHPRRRRAPLTHLAPAANLHLHRPRSSMCIHPRPGFSRSAA